MRTGQGYKEFQDESSDTCGEAFTRIKLLQRRLLRWYMRNGRDLPWRHTQNPYHILVSEIMLHQTQVNRAIPKYREWIAAYPTFEVLADSPLDEVKQLWRPLGYNFRAERLHKIAKFVVDECDGKLPDDLEELMALPGIGRYTAGAILSFAYHRDAPIVDTNVRRIIQRVFGVQGNRSQSLTKRRIWELAEGIIPTGRAHVFNQAIMDFGALVCTARNPACPTCFLKALCSWQLGKRSECPSVS